MTIGWSRQNQSYPLFNRCFLHARRQLQGGFVSNDIIFPARNSSFGTNTRPSAYCGQMDANAFQLTHALNNNHNDISSDVPMFGVADYNPSITDTNR